MALHTFLPLAFRRKKRFSLPSRDNLPFPFGIPPITPPPLRPCAPLPRRVTSQRALAAPLPPPPVRASRSLSRSSSSSPFSQFLRVFPAVHLYKRFNGLELAFCVSPLRAPAGAELLPPLSQLGDVLSALSHTHAHTHIYPWDTCVLGIK